MERQLLVELCEHKVSISLDLKLRATLKSSKDEKKMYHVGQM